MVVVPRAKRTQCVGLHGGVPKIALAAPPVDGRANEELLDFLKGLLGVSGRSLELVKGAGSKQKSVLIRGVPVAFVETALEIYRSGD